MTTRPVPDNNYDLPDRVESEFWLMAQGEHDYVVHAVPVHNKEHGTMLVACTVEGAIYLTKEQAMKFFDLQEKQ